ncbi:polysaccharide deacetylase family protein [Gammaproteobacteria bacterium]|nr:polysaccharide deacetylase family protein [Gammaproteobacteria bacterium]
MNYTHSVMFHHFHNEDHSKSQGSLSSSEFSEMLDWLDLKFNLLGAKEYLTRLNEGRLRSRDICLSFDDALLCQHDIALPILNERNLEAFFFVYSSIFTGQPEKLEIYRYFRTNAYKNTDEFYEDFFQLVECNFYDELINHKSKFSALDYLSAYPFYTENDRWFRYLRDQFLNQNIYNDLMHQLMERKNFSSEKIIDSLWMSEAHLKEIAKSGHEVGLHSFSHPTKISKLSYDAQKEEYILNYNHLTKLLGTIVSMSHPCGDYNDDTLTILSELGMQIGFRSSFNPRTIKSNLEIPREDHINILKLMRL